MAWTELSNIPVPYRASLITLRGQVLAIGGSNQLIHGTPTGAIHQQEYQLVECYWRDAIRYSSRSPTQQRNMGGDDETDYSAITEIASSK